MPQYEYFRGYPRRFERARRSYIRWAVAVVGPLFLLALLGTACAAFALSELRSGIEIARLVALALLTAYFGMILWLSLHIARETSIVPYFKTELGGIHTFAQGHAVAQSCQALDAMALENGLSPLSAFGFNDDLAGEPLVWHPAANGLVTISGLLSVLRDRPQSLKRQEQLVRELTAIRDALQKASDREVPFCLLLRCGDVTSSVEWERRQGTCF